MWKLEQQSDILKKDISTEYPKNASSELFKTKNYDKMLHNVSEYYPKIQRKQTAF